MKQNYVALWYKECKKNFVSISFFGRKFTYSILQPHKIHDLSQCADWLFGFLRKIGCGQSIFVSCDRFDCPAQPSINLAPFLLFAEPHLPKSFTPEKYCFWYTLRSDIWSLADQSWRLILVLSFTLSFVCPGCHVLHYLAWTCDDCFFWRDMTECPC